MTHPVFAQPFNLPSLLLCRKEGEKELLFLTLFPPQAKRGSTSEA
jgi:hypothetical protein